MLLMAIIVAAGSGYRGNMPCCLKTVTELLDKITPSVNEPQSGLLG